MTRLFSANRLLSGLSSRLFRAAGLALVAIGVSGCASFGNSLPPAPTSAAVPDYKYVIGPGDSLNIVVWRNPELSSTVPVRPDGKFTSPLIEDMVAIGKNPTDLAREIEVKLKKYIQDPVVTVIVQNFAGPTSEQIRVVGQSAQPQAQPYHQKMTYLY